VELIPANGCGYFQERNHCAWQQIAVVCVFILFVHMGSMFMKLSKPTAIENMGNNINHGKYFVTSAKRNALSPFKSN
jgi:hypothetical protein